MNNEGMGEVYISTLGHVFLITAVLLVLGITFSTMKTALDKPTVQLSGSTGACVRILDKGKIFECVNLTDKRYFIEWVK